MALSLAVESTVSKNCRNRVTCVFLQEPMFDFSDFDYSVSEHHSRKLEHSFKASIKVGLNVSIPLFLFIVSGFYGTGIVSG